VYANGRYSSHQTTDLDADRLPSFLQQAVEITRALEPDEHRKLTPAALFADRPDIDLELSDPAVLALDRDTRLAWCVALDDAARQHVKVISATSGVYDGTQTEASASSNGFSGTQESTYCWLGAEITLRDRGDRRAEDSFYAGAPNVDDVPDAPVIADTALKRAIARLDADKGPTLKAPMLVDARAAAQLIGRLMGGANAQSVQQGRSFWADLAGTEAFSPKLTIIDDPLIVRGLGSRHYDREGIAAKAWPIVENGVVRNLYVQVGRQTLAELVGEVGTGIYVTSWLGGNADSTSGDFSLGLRGHLIENGRIGMPVGEMNVTGNLRELFTRLELVGNDPYPYSSTLAPSMVFADVSFSGI
jgi:PmbA protein